MDVTFFTWDLPYWIQLHWVPLCAGLTAGSLAFMAAGLVLRRRRLGWLSFSEEDLPWEELLERLKERYQAPDGAKSLENLPPDELCRMLVAEIPRRQPAAKPNVFMDERGGRGPERRASRRRWLNPIAVSFFAPFREHPLHGIIVNRSTGGFALLADFDFLEGTVLVVRALDAPEGVPAINVEVRHSRKAGAMWLLGCQYCQEVPWNVKVWFG